LWAGRPLQEQIRLILTLFTEIMSVDRVAVLLWPKEAPFPRDEKTLVPFATSGCEAFQPSLTVIRRALVREAGIISTSPLEDYPSSASVFRECIRSCLCAPLRTSRGILGVLYADAKEECSRSFGHEELEFAMAFATEAALAIERSGLREDLEREIALKASLSRFFSKGMLEEIAKDPERLSGGGKETPSSVLFADIRNYTQLADTLSPCEVAGILNRYLPAMSREVFRHGGVLEKYAGDAVMAFWGYPAHTEDHAEMAVACAIGMQKAVAGLNEASPGHPICFGIGVATGPAFLGNIGGDDYIQYAAIGRTTNLSARLCASAAAGTIVTCEETARRVGARFPLAPAGTASLKGFGESVRVFLVQGDSLGP
jgi:adenylate cyclase